MTEWPAGNDPIPMRKDIGQSRALAKRIRSRPKQCFFNCWRVIERLDQYAAVTTSGSTPGNRETGKRGQKQ